jgi:biotin operon repressor
MHRLTKRAKLVYFILSAKADEKNEAIVGKYELVDATGYKGVKLVKEAVKELKANGVIEVEHRDKDGYSLANKYKILKDKAELMAM